MIYYCRPNAVTVPKSYSAIKAEDILKKLDGAMEMNGIETI